MRANIFTRNGAIAALFLFYSIASAQKAPEPQPFPMSGFAHVAGISTLTGINFRGSTVSTVAFSFSNLVKLNPHFSTGIGFGIDFYELQFGANIITPFYGEGRFELSPQKEASAFLAVRAGYSTGVQGLNPGSKLKGGEMLDAVVGVRLYVKRRRAVNVSVGYRHQSLKEEYTSQWGAFEVINTNYNFNRFQLRLSLQIFA